MDATHFEELCEEKFSFLITDFGYSKKSTLSQTLLWKVTYSNDMTIVNIYYERRDQFIDVQCYPNGGDDSTNNYNFWHRSFHLQNILYIRAPELRLQTRTGHMNLQLADNEIIQTLDRSSSALMIYASDVLKGDFSILPRIQNLIRQGVDPILWSIKDTS